MELWLDIDGLPECLQEQSLEGHDLPDVAEERRDFRRSEEGGTSQRFQVVLQQIVQVLQ